MVEGLFTPTIHSGERRLTKIDLTSPPGRFTEQRKPLIAFSSRLSAGPCSLRPSLLSSSQVQAASLPCRLAERETHAIGRVQAPRSF